MPGEPDEMHRLAVLGRLAANVAHEINNPLGGILIYADLVLEDMDERDIRRENMLKIIREAERCRMIVQSLLNFSRQTPPAFTVTDINATISEALNNVSSKIHSRNIRVVEQFAELPMVPADTSQVQEVFENLLLNAVEALNEGGEITIASSVKQNGENGHVQILFSDNGPGIAPECLDKIFEPFFTTKISGHGTGLGLAASYSIVQRHRGTIAAENRPGGGATFTVCLPIQGNRT